MDARLRRRGNNDGFGKVRNPGIVMAGLVPAIHVGVPRSGFGNIDGQGCLQRMQLDGL